MIKLVQNIRVKKIIILIITGIFLLLISIKYTLATKDTMQYELKEVLQNQESIVDYVQDEATVYALISQSGQTDYGDFLVIFHRQDKKEWIRIYENDFTELKPWKIELADIDGDGEVEILTAVRKTTHFDKIEKNRMFIFNYREDKLIKKWTGSQIAGAWEDYIVGDLLNIPGEELIFIEQLEDGKERICIYYWFDFGFLLLAESEAYEDIVSLSIIEENRLLITYTPEHEERLTLMVKDGNIIEVMSEE
jgi:hypothetical protein